MRQSGQRSNAQVTTPEARTEALRRRGIRLALLIVVWDVIEGTVAVTAGLAAGSIALVGFGIDSVIEVFAASVVLWQLRGGARGRERPALRAIGATFLVLAAYVAFEAVRDLVGGSEAGHSPIGIVLNVVALAAMVPVAAVQWRTGRALDNEVLTAQAKETWLSNVLSVNVLVGLGLNAMFGLSWADPAVALLVAGFAAFAGVDAWREAGTRKT